MIVEQTINANLTSKQTRTT